MDVFYALSEPNRRTIMELLAAHGELNASQISNHFEMSSAAISQHLKVLREANLVHMQKRAQQRIYSLNQTQLSSLEDWTAQLKSKMDERFDAFEKLLDEEKNKQKNPSGDKPIN